MFLIHIRLGKRYGRTVRARQIDLELPLNWSPLKQKRSAYCAPFYIDYVYGPIYCTV
jgi:hypothetical protein